MLESVILQALVANNQTEKKGKLVILAGDMTRKIVNDQFGMAGNNRKVSSRFRLIRSLMIDSKREVGLKRVVVRKGKMIITS